MPPPRPGIIPIYWLLLMVLFENAHVFNNRSETRPLLRYNPLNNHILLFGAATAQRLRIRTMYVPGLNTVLGV